MEIEFPITLMWACMKLLPWLVPWARRYTITPQGRLGSLTCAPILHTRAQGRDGKVSLLFVGAWEEVDSIAKLEEGDGASIATTHERESVCVCGGRDPLRLLNFSQSLKARISPFVRKFSFLVPWMGGMSFPWIRG